MVSFQCDGCSDTVKKPKLDSHYPRCNASFTCLDCSTTFHNASQWRSHIQCVSEAEKYQKTLYKGPKGRGQGRDQNAQFNGHSGGKQMDGNSTVNGSSAGKFTPQNQNWTPGPPSQRGRGGPPHGWGQPRSYGSGANDTPLGTPSRLISTPPSASPAPVPALHPTRAPTIPSTRSTAAMPPAPTATEEEKKEKKKKRKAMAEEGGESSPVTAVIPEGELERKKSKRHRTDMEPSNAADAPPLAALSVAVATKASEDEKARGKKEKKERRKLAEAAATTEDLELPGNPSTRLEPEPSSKKERKREKKRKREAGAEAAPEPAVDIPTDEPKKRKKEHRDALGADTAAALLKPLKTKKERKSELSEGKGRKSLHIGEVFIDTDGEPPVEKTKKVKKDGS